MSPQEVEKGWRQNRSRVGTVENINHQLSAPREGGPALGAREAPKGHQQLKSRKVPARRCRSPWDGTLWTNPELHKAGGQQGAQRRAEVGGEAAAHRSGRAHAKPCVSSGLAQQPRDGLDLLCGGSWEP